MQEEKALILWPLELLSLWCHTDIQGVWGLHSGAVQAAAAARWLRSDQVILEDHSAAAGEHDPPVWGHGPHALLWWGIRGMVEVGVNVHGNVWQFCICSWTVILEVVLLVRELGVVVVLSLSLCARNAVCKGWLVKRTEVSWSKLRTWMILYHSCVSTLSLLSVKSWQSPTPVSQGCWQFFSWSLSVCILLALFHLQSKRPKFIEVCGPPQEYLYVWSELLLTSTTAEKHLVLWLLTVVWLLPL